MEKLALVLWALLLGQGAVLARHDPAAAPQGPAGGTTRADANLTCFRCFRVTSEARCRPAACAPADRVCVSHAVLFPLGSGMNVLLSKRCAPRCPNTNMVYEWLSGHRLLRRIIRQCCTGSFCNTAPPTPGGPWPLPGGLLLPLGLSLLKALL